MRLPDKRCIVLDMDGTIYMGDNPIKGAVAFVQRHWEDVDFFFLSNNTSKAPETYIKKLNGMGIPARREQLLSPVTPLVQKASIRRMWSATGISFPTCASACPN